jgi:hypothetical protein
MAEGQQMRWWKAEGTEEKLVVTVSSGLHKDVLAPLLPEAVVAPASSAEIVSTEEETDTWAELEAEARRRAELGKTENKESESFYRKRARKVAGYHFVGVVRADVKNLRSKSLNRSSSFRR